MFLNMKITCGNFWSSPILKFYKKAPMNRFYFCASINQKKECTFENNIWYFSIELVWFHNNAWISACPAACLQITHSMRRVIHLYVVLVTYSPYKLFVMGKNYIYFFNWPFLASKPLCPVQKFMAVEMSYLTLSIYCKNLH